MLFNLIACIFKNKNQLRTDFLRKNSIAYKLLFLTETIHIILEFFFAKLYYNI